MNAHMSGMRALPVLALATLTLAILAAPAAAQDLNSLNSFQIDQLRMEQEMARQRSVALQNELMAAEARLRAEQAVLDLQLSRALPARVPELPYPSSTPPAKLDASKLPSIPDAALAASNRRVEEATRRRR